MTTQVDDKVFSLCNIVRAQYLTGDIRAKRKAADNSTYPKGGVSCSKDSFVVIGSSVFQIKFCGKNPALRVAAKRQTV